MSKTKFRIFPHSLQLQGSSSHQWMQNPFFYLISHPITSAYPACSAFKICTFLTTFMITTHSSHCFIFSCLRDSTWSMALLSSVYSQPAARLITFRIRLTTSCLCSTIPIFFLSPSEYKTQGPCLFLYCPFLWLHSLPSALGTPASLVSRNKPNTLQPQGRWACCSLCMTPSISEAFPAQLIWKNNPSTPHPSPATSYVT